VKDELYEALFECWLGQPYTAKGTITASERGRLNTAVKELRDVGATPEDVRVRWDRLRTAWPTVTLTPQALCTHWNTAAAQQQPNGAAARFLQKRGLA
jgi:hypothetical protein